MSQYHPLPEHCADTVPIKVNRVFDSCSDRDCFSNIQILMDGGELPANVTMVKSRCVRVSDICMNIEPVPFNRGFYSIDLTYTFRVELMAYERACSSPVLLTGTAYASKNVILYGGESNTQTFFSSGEQLGDTNACCETINLPTAAVQVVAPIALEARIGSVCAADGTTPVRTVIMTLGLCHGKPHAGDHAGRGAGGWCSRYGYRTQRLPEPDQQRSGIPGHLPWRTGRSCKRHQRRYEDRCCKGNR